MEDRAIAWHGQCTLPEGQTLRAVELRLYGVYDGHGGMLVSQQLADSLHAAVAERACSALRASGGDTHAVDWHLLLSDAFALADAAALRICGDGSSTTGGGGSGGGGSASIGTLGSTAVLALVLLPLRSGDGSQATDAGDGRGNSCTAPAPPHVGLREEDGPAPHATSGTGDSGGTGAAGSGGGTGDAAGGGTGSAAAHVLVAHVGNSRAQLCHCHSPPHGGGLSSLEGHQCHAEQLSAVLHEAGQPEERARLEEAGGRVLMSPGGRWRLEGDLELSRSLGDAQYRRSGLTARPDVTAPVPLHSGHTFIILASDGVYEVMSPSAVCNHAAAAARDAAPAAAASAALPAPALPVLTFPRAPAIALGGSTGSDPHVGGTEEVDGQYGARATSLPPLEGCCDCHIIDATEAADLCAGETGRKAAGVAAGGTESRRRRRSQRRTESQTGTDVSPPSPAQSAAAAAARRVVAEAFNRGSSDNLATLVVDVPRLLQLWHHGRSDLSSGGYLHSNNSRDGCSSGSNAETGAPCAPHGVAGPNGLCFAASAAALSALSDSQTTAAGPDVDTGRGRSSSAGTGAVMVCPGDGTDGADRGEGSAGGGEDGPGIVDSQLVDAASVASYSSLPSCTIVLTRREEDGKGGMPGPAVASALIAGSAGPSSAWGWPPLLSHLLSHLRHAGSSFAPSSGIGAFPAPTVAADGGGGGGGGDDGGNGEEAAAWLSCSVSGQDYVLVRHITSVPRRFSVRARHVHAHQGRTTVPIRLSALSGSWDGDSSGGGRKALTSGTGLTTLQQPSLLQQLHCLLFPAASGTRSRRSSGGSSNGSSPASSAHWVTPVDSGGGGGDTALCAFCDTATDAWQDDGSSAAAQPGPHAARFAAAAALRREVAAGVPAATTGQDISPGDQLLTSPHPDTAARDSFAHFSTDLDPAAAAAVLEALEEDMPPLSPDQVYDLEMEEYPLPSEPPLPMDWFPDLDSLPGSLSPSGNGGGAGDLGDGRGRWQVGGRGRGRGLLMSRELRRLPPMRQDDGGGGDDGQHDQAEDGQSDGRRGGSHRGGTPHLPQQRYRLAGCFGAGHFGEVWHAIRRSGGAPSSSHRPPPPSGWTSSDWADCRADEAAGGVGCGFVLKRLLAERGEAVRLSGLREVYFGELMARQQRGRVVGRHSDEGQGFHHLVRFEEAFEVPAGGDLWLVFHNEGTSLHDLMYQPTPPPRSFDEDDADDDQGGNGGGTDGGEGDPGALPLVEERHSEEGSDGRVGEDDDGDAGAGGTGGGTGFQVLGPSAWWHSMRRGPQGHACVRALLRQTLLALEAVHSLNITHRDVKPENLMMMSAAPPPAPAAAAAAGANAAWQSTPGEAAAPPGPGALERQEASSSGGRRLGSGQDAAASGAARGGWWWWGGAGLAGRGGQGLGGGGDGSGGSGAPHSGHGAAHQSGASADVGSSGGGEAGARRRAGAEAHGGGAHPGEDHDSGGGGGPSLLDLHLRLIDFGSAVDAHVLGAGLYGAPGPSAAELTLEYSPPEALFGRYYEGATSMKPRPWAYDVWGVGVVWLELLLGTPHPFQLPAHSASVLDARLRSKRRPEGDRLLAHLLRGLMEWCIYPPKPPSGRRDKQLPVSWSCTDQAMMALIRQRDPTGVGIENVLALRLLHRLLHWEPSQRPTARQALDHAYFTTAATGQAGGDTPRGADEGSSAEHHGGGGGTQDERHADNLRAGGRAGADGRGGGGGHSDGDRQERSTEGRAGGGRPASGDLWAGMEEGFRCRPMGEPGWC